MLARWHYRGKRPAFYIPKKYEKKLNLLTGHNLEVETDGNTIYLKKTDKTVVSVQTLRSGTKYITIPVNVSGRNVKSKNIDLNIVDDTIIVKFL